MTNQTESQRLKAEMDAADAAWEAERAAREAARQAGAAWEAARKAEGEK